MPATVSSNSRLKAACSVTQMASMVGLSRARFYELVDRGVFAPPVYSTATKRPFFPREIQQRNVDVRRDQMGVNGEYVLFYESRNGQAAVSRRSRPERREPPRNGLTQRLLPQLQNLGLSSLNGDAVARAVAACYPDGVGEIAETEVLRTVYRYLRRQNDA